MVENVKECGTVYKKVCEEAPGSGYGAKPVCVTKPVEECGTVERTVYKKLPDTQVTITGFCVQYKQYMCTYSASGSPLRPAPPTTASLSPDHPSVTTPPWTLASTSRRKCATFSPRECANKSTDLCPSSFRRKFARRCPERFATRPSRTRGRCRRLSSPSGASDRSLRRRRSPFLFTNPSLLIHPLLLHRPLLPQFITPTPFLYLPPPHTPLLFQFMGIRRLLPIILTTQPPLRLTLHRGSMDSSS